MQEEQNNLRRNFPDEAVVAQAVDDHPTAIVREDGGDHRNDCGLVPGLVAQREAGRGRGPCLELARQRLPELAQELRPPDRGRQAEVFQGKRANLTNVFGLDAEDGSSVEHFGQPWHQILAPVPEHEDEAAVIESGVLPFHL